MHWKKSVDFIHTNLLKIIKPSVGKFVIRLHLNHQRKLSIQTNNISTNEKSNISHHVLLQVTKERQCIKQRLQNISVYRDYRLITWYENENHKILRRLNKQEFENNVEFIMLVCASLIKQPFFVHSHLCFTMHC